MSPMIEGGGLCGDRARLAVVFRPVFSGHAAGMGPMAMLKKMATSMTVGAAREAAVDWLSADTERQPGFRGAYFIGSSVHLPDDAELPADSDIDVAVVIDEAKPSLKPGKLLHRGALLEISVFPWKWFSSVDEFSSSYHLAAGFQTDTILADPSGALRALQRHVARSFCEEAWVRRRSKNALAKVEKFLAGIDVSAPWHDQAMGWLFATGVTTHVLLVAALKNPTVRLRYLAVREVIEEYGRRSLYSDLLGLLGCAEMTSDLVAHHLAALAKTFDAAAAVAKTAFSFSSDITSIARPIAIDGSRKLIESGDHREAIFWMIVTFARCNKILASDAPPTTVSEFAPAFNAILSDLGIRSLADLSSRGDRVRRFLPELWETAEEIIAANPCVVLSHSGAL
ncbi:MAG TPA: hypothetical protein VKM54_21140 [Myxococcota bacterium]|nr:hypothetical protein [Myxococcota bacterium]